MPDRLSASGILGVITVASGISFLISTSSASLVMSFLPLVDTITGSNTILTALYFLNSSAISSTMYGSDTIPIFTASGLISSNTASIWLAVKPFLQFIIPYTPVVFCAVSDVITLIPYTPCAANVFKSACIPAPPLQSLPAIVNTFFIISLFPYLSFFIFYQLIFCVIYYYFPINTLNLLYKTLMPLHKQIFS